MRWIQRAATRYFGSGWIPATLSLLLLAATGAFEFAGPYRFAAAWTAFSYAFMVSLLGVLAAALWNFIRKRYLKGFLNLLALPACFVAMMLLAFATMFGPSEDGFADNLAIPPGLELAEPLPENEAALGKSDSFQRAVLAALDIAGPDNTDVTASAPSLVKLAREHGELLRRYLASSASWRLHGEQGKRLTTRRWMIGDLWQWDLHGYYTRHSIDRWDEGNIPEFQTRLTLGLAGKPFYENGATTKLKLGETAPLELRQGNGRDTSHCVIEAEPLAIEIFEERAGQERRITKATLAELEKEFAPLAANPTWETARTLLPAGSVTRGAPSLELRNAIQGGIYEATARVNPGEPGHVYLKAFEVTQGTPLSKRRLENDSNEWVGWSEDPEEQFLSNTQIMIGEGDWGKYYAARFELWFVPDSGAPERKLLEKNFKIEGWMR